MQALTEQTASAAPATDGTATRPLSQVATHLRYITWAIERFARAECPAELAAHHYPNMDLPKFGPRNQEDFNALQSLFETLQAQGIVPATIKVSLVITELGDTGAVIFTDETRLKTA